MIDIGQSITGSETGGAIISDCGKYRYRLWRQVGPNTESRCLFDMLNPSNAHGFLGGPAIPAQNPGFRGTEVGITWLDGACPPNEGEG